MSSEITIFGTIYLDNSAGRALRKSPRQVLARDVLYTGGWFSAGQAVYVAFRGSDGGQYVVASAVATCDASELPQWPDSLSRDRDLPALARVVVAEQGLNLLWASD